MPLPQLQLQLTTFLSEPDKIGLQLFFVSRNNSDFDLLEPALENERLEPTLKKDFIEEILRRFFPDPEAEDLELVNLHNAEATDRNTIYEVPINDIPRARNLFDLLANENQIEDYDPKQKPFEDIWGFVIKLATADTAVYLFKRNYPVNVVKRGRAYPLMFTQGSLQLETRPLLKFSPSFELLKFQNNLYIINKDEFEKSFDYIQAVEAKANAAIDVIISAGIVDDASKFYDLAQKRNVVKKIISIQANNPVFNKSAKQIVSFGKKYGLAFALSDDKTRVSIANQKDAKNLLKLFNDDLLLSELSNNKYDSRGKQKIETE